MHWDIIYYLNTDISESHKEEDHPWSLYVAQWDNGASGIHTLKRMGSKFQMWRISQLILFLFITLKSIAIVLRNKWFTYFKYHH